MKKIIFLVLCIALFGSYAFGYSNEIYYEDLSTKNNIEQTYGINIIIPEEAHYSDFIECIRKLESSLKKFPDKLIKEITDYYLSQGKETNVIIDRAESIEDMFFLTEDEKDSVNIYIKTLKSDFCFVPEEAILHELGHYISDYIFKIYDFEDIKKEFDRLNEGYQYGSWGQDYCKVFVNKHSATGFKHEIADLIWYAEANPSLIRNINGGNTAIIHEKLNLLAQVFEEVFISISQDTKLWLDTLPQDPGAWAKDTIDKMEKVSLIPEELKGLYQAHMKKEDFYKLIINMLRVKVGEDNFNNYFNTIDYEEHVALDPVNGEVYVADGMNYKSYLIGHDEKILNVAYEMGLISPKISRESEEYVSRIDIAKLLVYVGNKLGLNYSDYEPVNFSDLTKVDDNDKHYIYIAANLGLIKGDGMNFKPFEYCTYEETYVILMRFYDILKESIPV